MNDENEFDETNHTGSGGVSACRNIWTGRLPYNEPRKNIAIIDIFCAMEVCNFMTAAKGKHKIAISVAVLAAAVTAKKSI